MNNCAEDIELGWEALVSEDVPYLGGRWHEIVGKRTDLGVTYLILNVPKYGSDIGIDGFIAVGYTVDESKFPCHAYVFVYNDLVRFREKDFEYL